MSGFEVLGALGVLGAELFKYNRENYEFDQDQRFEREELRLKMQVERFQLFREDIRDLVELTVSKMDLYHLVGALFFKGMILYYCKGRIEYAPPPSLLALYYVSMGGAACFLLLAIWLAMHASICCTGFGTRLLVRYVRLPIPGSQQINLLNARFADYERQGLRNMLRMPFINSGSNGWWHRAELSKQALATQAEAAILGKPAERSRPGKAGASSSSSSVPAGLPEDHLQAGEMPFGNPMEMIQAVELRTQEHILLFRKLQAQWQCYDAYARVCMSIGVRQMLQAITYYLIAVTMVDNQNPQVAYMLTIAMQAAGMAVSVLDIHGLRCPCKFDIQLVGFLPAIICCLDMSIANRDERGILDPNDRYYLMLGCFVVEVIWFELLVYVASPVEDDETAMPRHFRTVLFMDVFGPVDDPTRRDMKTGRRKLSRSERAQVGDLVARARTARSIALQALGQWDAAVAASAELSEHQTGRLRKARNEAERLLGSLRTNLKESKLTDLAAFAAREWGVEEGQLFERAAVGPFERYTGAGLARSYFFLADRQEFVYELPPDFQVLNVEKIGEIIEAYRGEVALVLAALDVKSAQGAEASDSESETETNSPLRPQVPRRHTLNNTLGHQRTQVQKLRGGEKLEKPDLLPWQVLKHLTRAIQLAWAVLGVLAVLRSVKLVEIDFQQESHIGERRLLGVPSGGSSGVAEEWSFEQLEVRWPYGAFFRPESLVCPRPGQGPGGLLLGSPFALYGAGPRGGAGGAGGALGLVELEPEAFPPGATPICWPQQQRPAEGPPAAEPCLWGLLTSGGASVELWPMAASHGGAGGARRPVEVPGHPWQRFSGAVVDCNMSGHDRGANARQRWCLLLAGWAGGAEVAVSMYPLQPQGGGQLPLPYARAKAAFRYDVALGDRRSCAGGPRVTSTECKLEAQAPAVVGLHVDSETGELWISESDGALQVWDLARPQPGLTRSWSLRPPPSIARSFELIAACKVGGHSELLLVGDSGRGAPGRGGKVLLRALGPAH